MLRIVPHTVPRVGRLYEHFPDGFELHLQTPPMSPIFEWTRTVNPVLMTPTEGQPALRVSWLWNLARCWPAFFVHPLETAGTPMWVLKSQRFKTLFVPG
jgi:hypothetical protein